MPQEFPSPEVLLQHHEFLRALARQLVGDEQLAEDVVQESFIAALAHPPRNREALRSWLGQVVKSLAANKKRSEARRRRREREAAWPERLPSAEAVSESLHVQRRVLAALEALSEPYKTTLYLRWYEDLPPREIARRMGVPVETVRSRVRRGLARLRTELDDEFGERERWALALAPLARFERRLRSAALGLGLSSVALLVVASVVWSLRPRTVLPNALRPVAAFRAFAGNANALEPVPRTGAERVQASGARVSSAASPPPGAMDGGHSHDLDKTPDNTPDNDPGGPVFELALSLPPGLRADQLVAELLTLDENAAAGTVPRTTLLARAGVQQAPGCFVVFAPLAPLSLTGSAKRNVHLLRVMTRDGLFAGAALVHALGGHYPVPVVLQLEARGSLCVRLTDERGEPVPDGLVSVSREAEDSPEFSSRSDEQGSATLRSLSPGVWTLRACSPAHAVLSQPIEIHRGEPSRVEVQLERLRTMRVAGEVWSRTGHAHEPLPMRLQSTAHPRQCFLATPVPGSPAGPTLSFDFGDVPLGDYLLLPPADSPFAWQPPLRRINASALHADLERLDGLPLRRVHVRAYERQTGAPIEHFQTTLLVDRYGVGTRGAAGIETQLAPRATTFGEAPWPAVAEGLPVHWLVEREGYLAQQGDEEEFLRSGDEWFLDVEFAPAWRATFWTGTLAPDGSRRPIEGVRLVTSAGRELGRSLADGLLYLELSYDPGKLRVEFAGWRVRQWEGFWHGKARAARDLYSIWLEREP